MSCLKDRYNIIGTSKHISDILGYIERVAPHDVNILVIGEPGTGKELVAKNIHEKSKRNSVQLQTINCGSIPYDLVESELFGYERGAFTNASSKGKVGYFELANNGTLFLDEIGDMRLDIQPKILRAVEYKTYRRVGGVSDKESDVRVVSATNKLNIFDSKEFRQDLLYRLAGDVVELMPLRTRLEDVEPVARHFLGLWEKNVPDAKRKAFSSEAIEALCKYHFPGNFRELAVILHRAYIDSKGNFIDPKVIDAKIEDQKRLYKIEVTPSNGRITYAGEDGFSTSIYPWSKESSRRFYLDRIAAAIKYGGSITGAAAVLGTTPGNISRILSYYSSSLLKLSSEYGLPSRGSKAYSQQDIDLNKHMISLIENILSAKKGNIKNAAKYLHVSENELLMLVKKLDIKI